MKEEKPPFGTPKLYERWQEAQSQVINEMSAMGAFIATLEASEIKVPEPQGVFGMRIVWSQVNLELKGSQLVIEFYGHTRIFEYDEIGILLDTLRHIFAETK